MQSTSFHRRLSRQHYSQRHKWLTVPLTITMVALVGCCSLVTFRALVEAATICEDKQVHHGLMQFPCSSISWRLLLPAVKARPPRVTATYEAARRTLLAVPTLRKTFATSPEGHATSHSTLEWIGHRRSPRRHTRSSIQVKRCHRPPRPSGTKALPQAGNATWHPSSSLILWGVLPSTTKATRHSACHSHDPRCSSPS